MNKGIEPQFIPRILVVSFFSLLTSPLRIIEQVCYDWKVHKTKIHPSPVIILGHWRTGTTHLHNILCQDKRFGYVTTYQAMAPGFLLVGEKTIKPLLSWIIKLLYPTRMIDNIPLSVDLPQEGEYAVANMCPYSFLHMFSFPKKAKWFFERFVLFKNLPEDEQLEWINTYLKLLKKVTIVSKGAQLILKNPAHSGRLPAILKVFPKAKFIHLIRNPYDVYLSMEQLHKVVIPRSQLQEVNWECIQLNILNFYSKLMKKFITQKTLIPESNLVEVKFESLEATPIAVIKKIYHSLDLPNLDLAKPNIMAYLDSVSEYQKNRYTLTPEIINNVNHHWGFAFEHWGYDKRKG
jgi:hypothetical protein